MSQNPSTNILQDKAEVVHAAGKAARKRTISMTKDLLELDDLSLADDISTYVLEDDYLTFAV
jgi:hypothetical protein